MVKKTKKTEVPKHGMQVEEKKIVEVPEPIPEPELETIVFSAPLAVAEPAIEQPKPEVYVAIRDLTLTYRNRDVVPTGIVKQWKSMGFKIELMVKKI